ncbi:MAG: NIPSNAP family protein [Mariniblastus sp.]
MRFISQARPSIYSFLLGLGILCLSISIFQTNDATAQETEKKADQEYYELRIYKIWDYEKQMIAESHLKDALLPALNRMGLDRVGVFTSSDENDHSIFVIIPYPNIEKFTNLNKTLAADKEYQTAAASYFARELKDPIYQRIESRFMKAFEGMPVMEIPQISKDKSERIFELRLYQSHTEDHARRKVLMFNDGEIQIMRDTKLGPVFFGETLIGPDVPNLVYMLSSKDSVSHTSHWKAFLNHPEWKRIKNLEIYKDTVSKIEKWILKPTSYSQI